MAYRDWLNRKYGFAQDFTNLKEHDEKFHGGSYDPKTQRCKLRQRLDKEDAEIDSLAGADKERADKLENEEAMAAAASYLKKGAERMPDKWRKSAAEPVHLDKDGKPYNGEDWDDQGPNKGRRYKDGKPAFGVFDGNVYLNGWGFHGKIAGKFWRGGQMLTPTFQQGGTKSKYRLMRNALIEKTIDDGDHTADLVTGEKVEYPDGFQVAFQTTDSENPNKPGFIPDERYDELVEEMAASSGSKPHLGIYGVPEVSFRFKDVKQACDAAFGKYNQEAVLDWSTRDLIWNQHQDTSTNSVYVK